jgi:hypothetical protein
MKSQPVVRVRHDLRKSCESPALQTATEGEWTRSNTDWSSSFDIDVHADAKKKAGTPNDALFVLDNDTPAEFLQALFSYFTVVRNGVLHERHHKIFPAILIPRVTCSGCSVPDSPPPEIPVTQTVAECKWFSEKRGCAWTHDGHSPRCTGKTYDHVAYAKGVIKWVNAQPLKIIDTIKKVTSVSLTTPHLVDCLDDASRVEWDSSILTMRFMETPKKKDIVELISRIGGDTDALVIIAKRGSGYNNLNVDSFNTVMRYDVNIGKDGAMGNIMNALLGIQNPPSANDTKDSSEDPPLSVELMPMHMLVRNLETYSMFTNFEQLTTAEAMFDLGKIQPSKLKIIGSKDPMVVLCGTRFLKPPRNSTHSTANAQRRCVLRMKNSDQAQSYAQMIDTLDGDNLNKLIDAPKVTGEFERFTQDITFQLI